MDSLSKNYSKSSLLHLLKAKFTDQVDLIPVEKHRWGPTSTLRTGAKSCWLLVIMGIESSESKERVDLIRFPDGLFELSSSRNINYILACATKYITTDLLFLRYGIKWSGEPVIQEHLMGQWHQVAGKHYICPINCCFKSQVFCLFLISFHRLWFRANTLQFHVLK